ncbi:HEAT repeat domain-containing protein [Synechococcus elongatus IITB7]|uniref:HEAT repeat domain-containing protein n=1 Tax=Synechococcus elongatus TaxID=32046 RepID=UPI0030D3A990
MSEAVTPAEALTYEQAIANLRQTADTGLRYYAAWWLGRFRMKQPEAIALLIEALEDTLDRAPDGGYPLRRNAARALGKLESTEAIAPLITCLECEDYYVREAATQSLGELQAKIAIPDLLKLLEGGPEAIAAIPGKPHLTQPADAVMETLGQLRATIAIPVIQAFLDHPLDKIRLAAARSLYQLTGDDQYAEQVVQGLRDPKLQRRRSALMDLGAIGYLPAAPQIAQTLAENSLKLISLKGLLDAHLQRQSLEAIAELDESAIGLMDLMDSLL